jgi:uncharacterized protein (DUF1778 family)
VLRKKSTNIDHPTTTSKKHLLQVRVSENDKRNIKTTAASQGMTLREAMLAAFTAWAEKLRAQAAAAKASKATG